MFCSDLLSVFFVVGSHESNNRYTIIESNNGRYTFLPLVVNWMGSSDEWGDWQLVNG